MLGRLEEALSLRQEVYSRRLKLNGEDQSTITAALCYTSTLRGLKRFEEAKSLMRKTMPVARRVLGESHELTLRVSYNYAEVLYKADSATLDDRRAALTTLEDTERTARRVLGGAHPTTMDIGGCLQESRAVLHAHETGNLSSLREAMEALTPGLRIRLDDDDGAAVHLKGR